MKSVYVILLKLVSSAVAGGILGLERESKHKPLGLKTCIVISVASCLLTIVSMEVAASSYTSQLVRADPMRLAAQIVSGVGFLGAGVILRKSNDAISGLTTAAIVWAASGLGIAVGAGYYFETALGVVLIFLGIKVIPYIMKKIGPRAMREQGVKLTVLLEDTSIIQAVVNQIRTYDISIKEIKITGTDKGHSIQLHCTVVEKENYILSTYDQVCSITGVKWVEIEEV